MYLTVNAQYTLRNSTFSNGVAISTDSITFNSQSTTGQGLIGISENNANSIYSGFFYSGWNIMTNLDNLSSDLPVKFELFQNYPNPFNPATSIKFALPKTSKVKIDVFNILGEHVSTILNVKKAAGYHVIQFNANQFASGVYLYTIKADQYYKVKKMVLVK